MTQKIVLVSVISNLEFGGAQRQLVELSNHFDPARIEHHIVSLSDYVPLADDLRPSATLHVIQKGWKFDLSVVFRLRALLRSLRADVVHGYLFDAEIAARLAGWLAGTALVVGAERNTEYHIKAVQRVVYALTKPLMDICIANSKAGAAFNERMLGHRAEQYRVVPNGVNTERFAPAPSARARAELGLPPEEFAIGVVASFKPQKNHAMVFRAVREVLDAGVTLKLVLVGGELWAGLGGTGEYKQQMLDLVAALELEPYCLFLGNRLDLERIYPAFDVTVLSSLFEGTPNVVLESMACGVPALVTDVSDNRELVRDGITGYVVDPDDHAALARRLESLARDRDLCRQLGEAARAWVLEEYSTERLARRTEDVYFAALAER